jgi:hypothetical protein
VLYNLIFISLGSNGKTKYYLLNRSKALLLLMYALFFVSATLFVSVVAKYLKFAISVSSVYCYFRAFIFILFFASLTLL